MKKNKAIFCWSGGKDSSLALYKVLQENKYDVCYLLTTINGNNKRISMHGIRESLLDEQVESIGIPQMKVYTYDTSNDEYEKAMEDAFLQAKIEGINYVIYGDIFLEDLRLYRERTLNRVGLKAVFPLWKKDTRSLIDEFIRYQFKTVVCCVNAAVLDKSYVGRLIDLDFVKSLPKGVDVCGENGEFHSFCFDGPIFKKPINIQIKEKIFKTLDIASNNDTKIGFWYSEIENRASIIEEYFPMRIVCLTEETTETLYLIGEDHRIVGISGFTVRPKKARKEKPIVSAFINADFDKIISLQPDLVIGFSDLQADIARELVKRGITVWINNHRSVKEIFSMMMQLGYLVGKSIKIESLITSIKNNIEIIKERNQIYKIKPKVYFEEWDDPLISGICWVSELIEIAGGIDIYVHNKNASLAKDRIIEFSDDVVKHNPDIIIASWCGKKFKKEKLLQRKNWQTINAVKNNFIFEIKSSIILQPGPAALTEGLQQFSDIIEKWHFFKKSNS